VPSVPAFARLSALAALYQLTAYDTAYLDLARQLGLRLATLDSDLRKAAIAEGLSVL
jgi:predicted nucleic acid-binding protein